MNRPAALAAFAMLIASPTLTAVAADTLLVAGGTGRTGQQVVRQAVEQGYEVRVLTRDTARARELFGDRIVAVEGDVREPDSLKSAFEGVRYVISAIGSNSRHDPTNTPEAVDYRGVQALVDAAKAAGVEQFVLVSSMGVTRITHPLNRFVDNILLWKALGENALRFSGVGYTIVRPGGLTDEPGGSAGFRVGQGDTMSEGRIPRADVAAVCLAALGNPAARDKTFEIVADPASERIDPARLFAPLGVDDKRTLGGEG
jgi:uncharacterized protein YbjT (DUF2867 family)